MSADLTLHRSYLYAPGDNPAIIDKALRAGADAVILDLEDAVAPSRKDEARQEVARRLAVAADDRVLHVRVSGPEAALADLDAVAGPGLTGVRIPKVESAEQVAAVGAWISTHERAGRIRPGSVRIYPSFESAVGLTQMAAVLAASPHVARAVLGAADLLADLGLAEGGIALISHVQAQLALASRAAGVGPPLDGAYPRLDDDTGLMAAAQRAKDFGFFGKSVIHPRQLPVVHAAFTPSPDQQARAQRIVEAFESARSAGKGAVSFDGLMLDAATVARARALVSFRSPTEGPTR